MVFGALERGFQDPAPPSESVNVMANKITGASAGGARGLAIHAGLPASLSSVLRRSGSEAR